MSLSPIGEPRIIDPAIIHALSDAATLFAEVDHYMKHGSVPDRKLADRCRQKCKALEAIIEDERKRRIVKESATPPK